MSAGIVSACLPTLVPALKWIGRNRIPGIEPGRKLTVRGRLGVKDGVKVVYNPYYELIGDD